ncbi:cytochrome P450 [Mycobacterium nebraskense]|uniref:cytochrome P450 n=1 Tax=Mycobacterium nebraskense TaxID=244292 RepID=UPI000617D3D5|nr:cytochrome P450 [Mycobacterium nebraskense]KKC06874.1 cytochrome P450 [Mycobacterium nebraskense]
MALMASMLLDPAVLQDPYDFYATLRQQAPVWTVPGTNIVTISTFALLSEALARPEDFSSTMHCLLYRDRDGLPARLDFGGAAMPTLAAADPPVHTAHRRAVFPELVARRMRTLEDDIRALSATLVKQALDDGRFDFMASVGNIVPITVVARLIGFRDVDPMQLLQAAFDSTKLVGGTMSMDELGALVVRTETIEGWIADQIAGTAEGGDEGILLAVRRALDAGTLHIGEATIILHTLLSAGGESTTSLLGNAVRMLAENPELQRRMREKPEELDIFVEEALRLESPFRQMMRSVPHDTELGGVDIASGSTALLLFAAGNRDPEQFNHPDQIDLTRDSPKRHLAFGHGIHFCVGATLARIEARAVLGAILEQTRDFSLDPDHAPRWVDSLLVRRHAELHVCAAPR